MRSRTLGTLALALLVSASPTQAGAAKANKIVGMLTGVTDHAAPSLQIRNGSGETREVRTDNKTRYITKWVPRLGQRYTDSKALVVGRCVEVELASEGADVAKLVRIGDAPADPRQACANFR